MFFPSTLLVGRQKGHLARKNPGVFFCWWWRFHWSFARFMAPVVTTPLPSSLTAIKLANPGSRGKYPLQRREMQSVIYQVTTAIDPAIACHYFVPGQHENHSPLAATSYTAWWQMCVNHLPRGTPDSVAAGIWTGYRLTIKPSPATTSSPSLVG